MEEDAAATRGPVRERVLAGRSLAGPVAPPTTGVWPPLSVTVRTTTAATQRCPAENATASAGSSSVLRAARAAFRPWAALCLATAAGRDGVLVTGARTPRWPTQTPRFVAFQPWAAVQKAMGGSQSTRAWGRSCRAAKVVKRVLNPGCSGVSRIPQAPRVSMTWRRSYLLPTQILAADIAWLSCPSRAWSGSPATSCRSCSKRRRSSLVSAGAAVARTRYSRSDRQGGAEIAWQGLAALVHGSDRVLRPQATNLALAAPEGRAELVRAHRLGRGEGDERRPPEVRPSLEAGDEGTGDCLRVDPLGQLTDLAKHLIMREPGAHAGAG